MELTINAAAFQKNCYTLGPGLRDGLWVQGCSILCRGCGNPAYLPHRPARPLAVSTLLEHFTARRECIDGLTISGGEPTEQALAVAALLEGVQALGLSTVVFTGRVYEELGAGGDPAIARLLAATDLLIDGPFDRALREPGLQWRGSRNQRLLYLTPRLAGREPDRDTPAFEIHATPDGMTITGVGKYLLKLPR